jgi:cytochrome c-type biogenesis protein
VSFASPCVVPLVPGYLSYMTGLSGAELAGRNAAAGCACSPAGMLFVLGFAIPFTLIGLRRRVLGRSCRLPAVADRDRRPRGVPRAWR